MTFDVARHFATVEPLRQRLIAWWTARSVREQALIAALAAAVLLWTIATQIVLPMLAARTNAAADIRTYEALNARLRQAGPGLAARPAGRSGSIATIVPASAAEFGIVAPVVTADGTGLRVVIAEAPYDAVIRWLAELERSSSARVDKVTLTRRPAAGMVGADILVRS